MGAGVVDASKNMDLTRLEHYLTDGVVRIPRAHLIGGGGRLNESTDSMSDGSSEYTIKEEIERKVITDVITKQIKTTTTTDNAGNVVTTTAESYVYPSEHTMSHGDSAATRSSFVGESSYVTRNSESSHDAAFSERQFHHHSGPEERERGESVAEFSIGRAKSKEYSTRECDMVHCSSQEQDVTQTNFEHEIGDAITRVTNSRHYEPTQNGESERFRSEIVTSQTSTSVNKY
ncbi:hypothetical protein KIN20_000485 [Parelaphostrongylus tenuis]|uniref:Uncharacterized protein n=1 Tax=Parelaphostrongylus tenuis TaxID=148309 RepID=A0AAD5MDC1_PARTN|nr:hypothetical protein KIN20_000485 [Parelaphostrongylus tenuis]